MNEHISSAIKKVQNTTSRLLPWDSAEFRKFVVFALIAILIRVLVMPFFGHIDFLSESRRVFRSFYLGELFPGSRYITSLVQQINFTIFSPLIAEKSSMFQKFDWTQSTAGFIQFFGFSDHHAILRTFFILKIPFLVFDIATSLVIYHFFKDKKASLRASIVWFFNPLTIFAFYVYGRYESIQLFFLALTLFNLKKDNLIWAFMFMGLAIWSREFNLILCPLLVIYVIRCKRFHWLKKLAAFAVILFFIGMAANILPEKLGFINDGKEGLAAYNQAIQFLGFPLVWYYPFIIVYSLLGFWMFLHEDICFHHLLTSLGIFYCSFYFLAVHSVHYVSWAMVVFAMLSGENRKFTGGLWIFCICWFVFWLFGTDLGVFTQWLAIPGSLFFANLPNIPQYFEKEILSQTSFSLGHVTGTLRSVYVSALIYSAIHLFTNRNSQKPCKE